MRSHEKLVLNLDFKKISKSLQMPILTSQSEILPSLRKLNRGPDAMTVNNIVHLAYTCHFYGNPVLINPGVIW